MYISKKQRAIINSAVKPFYITSNYLGPGLKNLLKYYSKYFAQRRFSLVHFLPDFKNAKTSYILTVLFQTFVKKGGFAKKRRPITWTFYGNILLTKYGRKKQQKNLKRKRKLARRQRLCAKQNETICQQPEEIQKEIISIIESSSNDSVVDNYEVNSHAQIKPNSIPANVAETKTNEATTEFPKECNLDSNVARIDSGGDDAVDNIWNLDIQEVAELITESGTDDKQLSESK